MKVYIHAVPMYQLLCSNTHNYKATITYISALKFYLSRKTAEHKLSAITKEMKMNN